MEFPPIFQPGQAVFTAAVDGVPSRPVMVPPDRWLFRLHRRARAQLLRTKAKLPIQVSTPEAPLSWLARLQVHLLIASVPLLAISADVFGLVTLQAVAIAVMLPLIAILIMLVIRRPDPSDRLLLSGFLWGMVACACYDAFRLPTIVYGHWWQDFFGAVGGWATGTESNYLVGYLWRYVGDGGGIAVVFFALAGTLGAAAWSRRSVIALGVGYAVFPVWTGLVLTDLFATSGRELFPLTATTLALSLIGHLIYGAVMGLGYWLSRAREAAWPLRVALAR